MLILGLPAQGKTTLIEEGLDAYDGDELRRNFMGWPDQPADKGVWWTNDRGRMMNHVSSIYAMRILAWMSNRVHILTAWNGENSNRGVDIFINSVYDVLDEPCNLGFFLLNVADHGKRIASRSESDDERMEAGETEKERNAFWGSVEVYESIKKAHKIISAFCGSKVKVFRTNQELIDFCGKRDESSNFADRHYNLVKNMMSVEILDPDHPLYFG